MKHKFYLFLLCIGLMSLMCSFISANGLQIVNNSNNLTVTKTFGQEVIKPIYLQNTESYSFYNITIENSNIIKKIVIPELAAGQMILVNLTLIGNNTFEDYLTIKGYFQARVGESNLTNEVLVDFGNGLNKCDFTIVRGDKVRWVSSVNDNIKLINEQTNIEVANIPALGNYTTNFDTPSTFKYAFYRRGLIFTDVCLITVLDDQGYVNDPNLDAKLELKLYINFEPTTLNATLVENAYNMSFIDETEGLLTIKNNGNKTARNVSLSGDWLTFNKNNFDLAVGEQKLVIYTIMPYITQTNDTNKNYIKNLTIKGNFPQIDLPLSIFINYSIIDNGNYNSSNITDVFMAFCNEHPDMCSQRERIIYRDLNNRNSTSFNVTFEQNQVRELISLLFQMSDTMDTTTNYYKQTIDGLNTSIIETKNKAEEMRLASIAEKEARTASETNTNYTVYIAFFIIVIGLLVTIAFFAYKLKKIKELERMQ